MLRLLAIALGVVYSVMSFNALQYSFTSAYAYGSIVATLACISPLVVQILLDVHIIGASVASTTTATPAATGVEIVQNVGKDQV